MDDMGEDSGGQDGSPTPNLPRGNEKEFRLRLAKATWKTTSATHPLLSHMPDRRKISQSRRQTDESSPPLLILRAFHHTADGGEIRYTHIMVAAGGNSNSIVSHPLRASFGRPSNSI